MGVSTNGKKKPAAAEIPAAQGADRVGKLALVSIVAGVVFLTLLVAWFLWSGFTKIPTSPAGLAATIAAQSTQIAQMAQTQAPATESTEEPTAALEATAEPTKLPAAAPTACRDGELVLVHEADAGDVLPRTPVGEAERVDIIEIGVPGGGFGGYDRFILITPRLGTVWMVNIREGARTIASRGFCGTNEAVASWAIQAHVPSFQQASRDPLGNQPPAEEIGVYVLRYEEHSLTEIKPGRLNAEDVVGWIDVSFHEGVNVSAVPLTVAPAP